jgi:hypothetical protein
MVDLLNRKLNWNSKHAIRNSLFKYLITLIKYKKVFIIFIIIIVVVYIEQIIRYN